MGFVGMMLGYVLLGTNDGGGIEVPLPLYSGVLVQSKDEMCFGVSECLTDTAFSKRESEGTLVAKAEA